MVAQNFTRFALTMVILGFVLALAIFRPWETPTCPTPNPITSVIASSGAPAELTSPKQCVTHEGLVALKEELEREREALEVAWEQLAADQAALEADRAAVALGLEELSQLETTFKEKESRLAELEALLDERESALEAEAQRLTRLRAQLQQWDANLRGRETELERLSRLCILLLVLSGLLSATAIAAVLAGRNRQAQQRPASPQPHGHRSQPTAPLP
jgi:septal ring factor EnvC (AmiA/AmiB activator)